MTEAPLPDGAEPMAEQRSSRSRRCSRPLGVHRASLLWPSLGLSHFGNREETPSQVSGLHQTLRDTAGAPSLDRWPFLHVPHAQTPCLLGPQRDSW